MANYDTLSNVKILYYGTQADYDLLESKDPLKLYFCTDSKKIWKGDIEMTEQVRFAATKAGITAPVAGKLYIIADTGTVEVYNGSTWTVVSYPIVQSTSSSGISNASTNTEVPSAKAVYDYVQSIVAGDSVVTNVEVSSTAGSIDVTIGDGEPVAVPVYGAVVSPSYTSATRTITLPVVQSDGTTQDFEIELGKDIFIDPDANNRYENGNIYIYLNDGEGTSKPPTEIVIPVTALVTDYFGDDTTSVSVDVDNLTHKVTAEVIRRPDDANFTNLLKVSSTTGAVGLYVDRTQIDANAAAIEILNGADSVTGSVAQQVKALADGAVATNTAAIGVLNGDATVTGSVDQKVKALADGAVATNTAAIGVLNGDATVTGSVAQQVKAASDALDARVTANEDAIEVLNGDATVTGSVAQQVKVVQDDVDILNGDATVTGSVAQQIASLKTTYVDVNASNIEVLAAAQGWGTF